MTPRVISPQGMVVVKGMIVYLHALCNKSLIRKKNASQILYYIHKNSE